MRTLLSHQAGLCVVDAPMTVATLADPDAVATAIGPQKPAWTPGERHGYHVVTLGWYECELIRRTDPQQRTIGRYFAEEIAAPLGLDLYIGLPDEVPAERLARIMVLGSSSVGSIGSCLRHARGGWLYAPTDCDRWGGTAKR